MSAAGPPQSGGHAWYAATRPDFLDHGTLAVAGTLTRRAASEGWAVTPDQEEEWRASVALLRARLQKQPGPLLALLSALEHPHADRVHHIALEYDLRRRGLRVDGLLFAPGLLLVLEFKRSTLNAAAVDQLTGYCTSLAEFHQQTQRFIEQGGLVVPVLVQTQAAVDYRGPTATRLRAPFQGILAQPVRCDSASLGRALADVTSLHTEGPVIDAESWLRSDFSPSSTILDAAISLYGHHDVSAIREHATSVHAIEQCVQAIQAEITETRATGGRRVILVSGAPGAGKTLVGLQIAMAPEYREHSVFVTGNAPLVDVLDAALTRSYKRAKSTRGLVIASGYPDASVRSVIDHSTFKLVKAHQFLGKRGELLGSTDGAILVFDEAQRTYEKGKKVAGHTLSDHEADLILQALEDTHGTGLCVVALIGSNQAINRKERGAIAWLEAAHTRGWTFAVSDATLALPELSVAPVPDEVESWATHPSRRTLDKGHLHESMRFYRNAGLERWAHHLLAGDATAATPIAQRLHDHEDTIWLTRDLATARAWIRAQRVGDQRAGIIANAQARRLAALGLHVDQKPNIATWMLAPTGDFRSGNMLETVQNQYQIQGLEIDWALVCWGADLRWHGDQWSAHKLSGANWQNDRALNIAQNGYRVLLTRARKGMVIYVPLGDPTGVDPTRHPAFTDGTAAFLLACGARPLPTEAP